MDAKTMDPSNRKRLEKAVKVLNKRREAEAETWEAVQELVREISLADPNATYAEIGKVLGVTKARAYQIVTGKRSTPQRSKDIIAALEKQGIDVEGALAAA
jgi:hypothetical protein